MKSKNKKVKRAKLRKGCVWATIFTTLIIIAIIVGFGIYGLNAYIQSAKDNTGIMLVGILFLGLFYFLAILIFAGLGAIVCIPLFVANVMDIMASGCNDNLQAKFRKYVIIAFILDIIGAVTVGLTINFVIKEVVLATIVPLALVLPALCRLASCIAYKIRKVHGKPLVDVLPSSAQITAETDVKYNALKDFSSKKNKK